VNGTTKIFEDFKLRYSLMGNDPLQPVDVVRAFASVSAGELCPVASFIGALAAQEAMKVSGRAAGSAVPKRSVATRGHLLPSWGLRALGAERRVG